MNMNNNIINIIYPTDIPGNISNYNVNVNLVIKTMDNLNQLHHQGDIADKEYLTKADFLLKCYRIFKEEN